MVSLEQYMFAVPEHWHIHSQMLHPHHNSFKVWRGISSDEVDVACALFSKALHYQRQLLSVDWSTIGRVLRNVPVLAEDTAKGASCEEDGA